MENPNRPVGESPPSDPNNIEQNKGQNNIAPNNLFRHGLVAIQNGFGSRNNTQNRFGSLNNQNIMNNTNPITVNNDISNVVTNHDNNSYQLNGNYFCAINYFNGEEKSNTSANVNHTGNNFARIAINEVGSENNEMEGNNSFGSYDALNYNNNEQQPSTSTIENYPGNCCTIANNQIKTENNQMQYNSHEINQNGYGTLNYYNGDQQPSTSAIVYYRGNYCTIAPTNEVKAENNHMQKNFHEINRNGYGALNYYNGDKQPSTFAIVSYPGNYCTTAATNKVKSENNPMQNNSHGINQNGYGELNYYNSDQQPSTSANVNHSGNYCARAGINQVNSENNQKKRKRSRTCFNCHQLAILEREYTNNHFLERTRRLRLARYTGLDERVIKIWFQNRRMKEKRNRTCNVDTGPYLPFARRQPYPVLPNVENGLQLPSEICQLGRPYDLLLPNIDIDPQPPSVRHQHERAHDPDLPTVNNQQQNFQQIVEPPHYNIPQHQIQWVDPQNKPPHMQNHVPQPNINHNPPDQLPESIDSQPDQASESQDSLENFNEYDTKDMLDDMMTSDDNFDTGSPNSNSGSSNSDI